MNDQGYRLLQARDYAGALPLLEQAVQQLTGTRTTTEAYALYNLAVARLALGRCDGLTALLDRSEQIQGRRAEIDRLRGEVRGRCG